MKKQSKIKTFFLFLFAIPLFSFLSCSIFDFQDVQLEPLEGTIRFSVREGYQDITSISEPSIVLQMVTEKVYNQRPYYIISWTSVNGDEIFFDIWGVDGSKAYFDAFGPASSESFLDIANGKYSLYLSYRDTTDTYSLILTDSFIKVTNDMSQFTDPLFILFWRYPPNSFAYLCGTTTETSWICEDFLDTLLSEVDIEEFQFPDSGTIPYPCSSGGHYYDMPAKYFFYDTDEDFDKAGEISQSYTQRVISQYSGVGISLINWKNKKYYSWVFLW